MPYFRCICGHNYLFVCLFVIVVIFSVLGLFFVTPCISAATVTSLLRIPLYDGMPVFPSLPSLSPFISLFCYRLNLLDELARKRLPRRPVMFFHEDWMSKASQYQPGTVITS